MSGSVSNFLVRPSLSLRLWIMLQPLKWLSPVVTAPRGHQIQILTLLREK